MAAEQSLVDQLLGTREDKDVRRSPLVTAVLLQDVSYVPLLVAELDSTEGLRARNARRILCLFELSGVPPLLNSFASLQSASRARALEVLHAMCIGEETHDVRDVLESAWQNLAVAFADKTSLLQQQTLPVEDNFRGRVCDLAFVLVNLVLSPEFDSSRFCGMDYDERDEQIRRFSARRSSVSFV